MSKKSKKQNKVKVKTAKRPSKKEIAKIRTIRSSLVDEVSGVIEINGVLYKPVKDPKKSSELRDQMVHLVNLQKNIGLNDCRSSWSSYNTINLAKFRLSMQQISEDPWKDMVSMIKGGYQPLVLTTSQLTDFFLQYLDDWNTIGPTSGFKKKWKIYSPVIAEAVAHSIRTFEDLVVKDQDYPSYTDRFVRAANMQEYRFSKDNFAINRALAYIIRQCYLNKIDLGANDRASKFMRDYDIRYTTYGELIVAIETMLHNGEYLYGKYIMNLLNRITIINPNSGYMKPVPAYGIVPEKSTTGKVLLHQYLYECGGNAIPEKSIRHIDILNFNIYPAFGFPCSTRVRGSEIFIPEDTIVLIDCSEDLNTAGDEISRAFVKDLYDMGETFRESIVSWKTIDDDYQIKYNQYYAGLAARNNKKDVWNHITKTGLENPEVAGFAGNLEQRSWMDQSILNKGVDENE